MDRNIQREGVCGGWEFLKSEILKAQAITTSIREKCMRH